MATKQQGFNADKRAEKREGRDIIVGGKTFRQRRRTNGLMREFRRLSREDGALMRKHDELVDRVNDLDLDWLKGQQEVVVMKMAQIPESAPPALAERLTVEHDEVTRKIAKLEEESSEEQIAERDEQRERLEDDRAKIEDERNELVYRMIAALIKGTGDDPGEVDTDFLDEHLDIEDAGDLLDFLTPGEAEPDPTPPPTTPPTSE